MIDFQAKTILDAVDAWAVGALMLRELECFDDQETPCDSSVGRMDALLVPTEPWFCPWRRNLGSGWGASALVGVEVKVTGGDLARGIREQQFERYSRAVGLLYLAVPEEMAVRSATRDVPAHVGILAYRGGHADVFARCVRHAKPTGSQTSAAMLWKLLALMHKRSRAELNAAAKVGIHARARAGDAAGQAIRAALAALDSREAVA